jgi:hypothetical protein
MKYLRSNTNIRVLCAQCARSVQSAHTVTSQCAKCTQCAKCIQMVQIHCKTSRMCSKCTKLKINIVFCTQFRKIWPNHSEFSSSWFRWLYGPGERPAVLTRIKRQVRGALVGNPSPGACTDPPPPAAVRTTSF